ncbi:toxic anion resistance protein [Metabacillus sp. 84]|uniref:toxic anion resistance protein n=1 Tax=Metabacillus sp. 84 TaxID=3404705 RepID=UPI003CF2ABB4
MTLHGSFSEKELQRIREAAESINPGMEEEVASFGVPAQSKLLSLSDRLMQYVKEKDRGGAGVIMEDLMRKLEEADPEPARSSGILRRIFARNQRSASELISRYHKMSAQMDRVVLKLENSKQILLSDNAMLENLYEQNKEFHGELNVYIAAAEWKLDELQKKIIPSLQQGAESLGSIGSKEKEETVRRFAERLDRRLYDLKISREMTLQAAPQIRMIQKTNEMLVEKIQSSVLTSIPLWKSQVTMASTMLKEEKAGGTKKQMSMIEEKARLKETGQKLKRDAADSLKLQKEGQLHRLTAEQGLSAAEKRKK